jgi:uncharacterized protein YciI
LIPSRRILELLHDGLIAVGQLAERMPVGRPAVDDPRFPGHVAFLNRMREAGYLIAAGPLAGEDGASMTILRLPGAGQEGLASVLATSEDAAVREGLLSVTVRPWQVIMNVPPSSA